MGWKCKDHPAVWLLDGWIGMQMTFCVGENGHP